MMNLRLSTLSVCLFNQSVYQLVEALKARFDLGANSILFPEISEPKILTFWRLKFCHSRRRVLSTRSKIVPENSTWSERPGFNGLGRKSEPFSIKFQNRNNRNRLLFTEKRFSIHFNWKKTNKNGCRNYFCATDFLSFFGFQRIDLTRIRPDLFWNLPRFFFIKVLSLSTFSDSSWIFSQRSWSTATFFVF